MRLLSLRFIYGSPRARANKRTPLDYNYFVGAVVPPPATFCKFTPGRGHLVKKAVSRGPVFFRIHAVVGVRFILFRQRHTSYT